MHLQKGISIHGMKLLTKNNFSVSLSAIREYDNNLEEIKLLKNKAFIKKELHQEDFAIYFNRFKSTRRIVENVSLETFWNCIQVDNTLPSNRHNGKISVFYIEINEYSRHLRDKRYFKLLLNNKKASSAFYPISGRFNVPLMYVDYVIEDGVVRVNEIQAFDEMKHSNASERFFTSLALTEFVRLKYNEGYRKFRTLSSAYKRNIICEFRNNFPQDVYDVMVPKLGFTREGDFFELDLS